jgi:hypothetical protein
MRPRPPALVVLALAGAVPAAAATRTYVIDASASAVQVTSARRCLRPRGPATRCRERFEGRVRRSRGLARSSVELSFEASAHAAQGGLGETRGPG